ncbi:hypothetical protein PIB30_017672 [Stylosanthes scabra]|uniref:Uncharacterized protein n=1 Tax=Stylosanthes scabra TaxID=79078 RepID=A0ABU6Y5Y2_9FABA|nr:hypothetical protein [Stylosanthes scabra]
MTDRDTTTSKTAAQKPILERQNTKKARPNGDEIIPDATEKPTEILKEKPSHVDEKKTLVQAMEEKEGTKKPVSYKDSLMHDDSGIVLSPDEIVQMVAEDYEDLEFGENERADPAPFNPKPVIDVSLEEYDAWCKPWRSSLIVKLLGKTLSFRAIETLASGGPLLVDSKMEAIFSPTAHSVQKIAV